MTNLRRQEGQVTVLVAVFMVVLIGMAGFVIDVGSWFRQQRATQSTVDSAALAGAQSLPDDTSGAAALATTYAGENGGVAGAVITFTSRYAPNDTITVKQAQPATGFFSRLFGISTVTVRAHASAISELPTAVMGAAPIAVDIHHPMLSGTDCPCFGVPTTIPLGKKDNQGNFVPGAFGMIDLDTSNGNTGTSTLAGWIANGYNQYLPLGDYNSDPGAKFDSSQIQDALQGKYGSDLLFPVYDSLDGNGSNATYHVIGWAAFHVTLTQASGNDGTISGWFDNVTWTGIVPAAGPPPNMPNLGVHSVALVD
jgi:hypothetical protein